MAAADPTACPDWCPDCVLARTGAVVERLRSFIHRGDREVQIQDSIERVLRAGHRWRVQREFNLSREDRPDFLIDGHIVIEVKMRASGSAVLWQLGRYALDRRVHSIVVASPRLSSLGGIPAAIHGVPVQVAALQGGGLLR
jgi:hypothetical protein